MSSDARAPCPLSSCRHCLPAFLPIHACQPPPVVHPVASRAPLPQLPGSAWDASIPGEGFLYGYIGPTYPTVSAVIKEMCPHCEPSAIPRSGPAPVLMRFEDLRKATPAWEKYSKWIEDHAAAKETLGVVGAGRRNRGCGAGMRRAVRMGGGGGRACIVCCLHRRVLRLQSYV
jgi:hypothetical protein